MSAAAEFTVQTIGAPTDGSGEPALHTLGCNQQ